RARPLAAVTSSDAPASGSEAASAVGPTLVGRTEELARLREAFEALGRRQGSAILMRGEMGIGKSRLVNELLTAATIETRMLIGRSYESERSLAFGPWLDALRRGGVLRDTEAPAFLPSTSPPALGPPLPALEPAEDAGP